MQDLKRQTIQSEREIASAIEMQSRTEKLAAGARSAGIDIGDDCSQFEYQLMLLEAGKENDRVQTFKPCKARLEDGLTALRKQLKAQMARYQTRVADVAKKEFECIALLPAVHRSLMPQYRDVYQATGRLVQKEPEFLEFNLRASRLIVSIDRTSCEVWNVARQAATASAHGY